MRMFIGSCQVPNFETYSLTASNYGGILPANEPLGSQ